MSSASATCAICLESVTVDASTPDVCSDIFHDLCLKEWLANCESEAKCPTCSKVFSTVKSFPKKYNQILQVSMGLFT